MQHQTHEHNFDVPTSQILQETVEVVLVPTERVQQWTFYLPMPQISKLVDEVVRLVPQECVQQQMTPAVTYVPLFQRLPAGTLPPLENVVAHVHGQQHIEKID